MTTYTIKGLKSFRGNEGHGFNATLYRDGKKVCFVMDSAQGGEMDFEWCDRKAPFVEITGQNYKDEPYTYKGTPEEKILHDHVEGMFYPEEFHGQKLAMGTDGFVSKLVEDLESARWEKRQCQKKTLLPIERRQG